MSHSVQAKATRATPERNAWWWSRLEALGRSHFRRLGLAAVALLPLACSGILGIHDIEPPAQGDAGDASSASDGTAVDGNADHGSQGDATADGSGDAGGGNDAGDASRDSSSLDAATDTRGSGDACTPTSADAAIGVGPFCSSLSPAPFFCADFDEGPVASSWQNVVALGGSIQNGTVFVSPPNGMRVDTEAGAFGVEVLGADNFNSLGAAGVYTLDFQVYVSQGDVTAAADVLLAQVAFLDQLQTNWVLQLELGQQVGGSWHVFLSESGNTADGGQNWIMRHNPAPVLFAAGTWTHVTMQLDHVDTDGGPTNSATLLLDGCPVISQEALDVITIGGYPALLLGIPNDYNAAVPWSVSFDNVTFDYHP